MRFAVSFSFAFGFLAACHGDLSSTSDAGGEPHGDATSGDAANAPDYLCTPGAALAGAPWDVTKSRFDFGSTPTVTTTGALTKYVGTYGTVAVSANGGAMGLANADSPARAVQDWSNDPGALTAHVEQYLEGFNIAPCQIGGAQVFATGTIGGGDGGIPPTRIIHLNRAISGVPIVDSLAFSRLNANDQSDGESLYWPTVPASIVTEAKAFYDRLADPTALAQYQALLPANARGQGAVVIHHTSSIASTPLAFAVTWDVVVNESSDSFDSDGNAVNLAPILGL